MIYPESITAVRRVLFPLGVSSARDPKLFEAVAQLASEFQAELHALFIEDPNLLRMARLPLARELGYRDGRERPLDFDEMERSLRQEARRVERSLMQAAQHREINFSFEVTRGGFAQRALAAAEGADLVLLGNFASSILAPPTRTTHRRRAFAMSARSRVLVYIPRLDAAQRMLAIASRLSDAGDSELVVIVPPLAEGLLAKLRGVASASIECKEQEPRFVHLADANDPAALLDLVEAEAASMLILSSVEDGLSQAQLDKLVSRIGCPLVLLR